MLHCLTQYIYARGLPVQNRGRSNSSPERFENDLTGHSAPCLHATGCRSHLSRRGSLRIFVKITDTRATFRAPRHDVICKDNRWGQAKKNPRRVDRGCSTDTKRCPGINGRDDNDQITFDPTSLLSSHHSLLSCPHAQRYARRPGCFTCVSSAQFVSQVSTVGNPGGTFHKSLGNFLVLTNELLRGMRR